MLRDELQEFRDEVASVRSELLECQSEVASAHAGRHATVEQNRLLIVSLSRVESGAGDLNLRIHYLEGQVAELNSQRSEMAVVAGRAIRSLRERDE